MKTTTNPVQKRESLLISIYSEYQPGRDAFNFKKAKRKERASRLINELRTRYNNKVQMTAFNWGSVTADMVTENGKYSLD